MKSQGAGSNVAYHYQGTDFTTMSNNQTATRRSWVVLDPRSGGESNLSRMFGSGSAGGWVSMSDTRVSMTHATSSANASIVQLSASAAEIYGESVNVYARNGSGGRFRVPAVWNVKSTSGDTVKVNSQGTLFSDGSSRRYKQEIAPAEPKPSILDIEAKTYREIAAVEAAAIAREYLAEHGDGPLPPHLQDAELVPPVEYGAIAEEVHDLGLTELVGYDFAGRPSSLYYDKFGLALIPIVREQRERIESLEARIAALEVA